MLGEALPSMTDAAGIGHLPKTGGPLIVGVLEGEGVGPQLTRICTELLDAVSTTFGRTFDVRVGGAIGLDSLREEGSVLTDNVCSFCSEIFDGGGAILAGAGGGRFVYEMRRRFDLFVKLNPLQRYKELEPDGRVRWRTEAPLDILVVRENMGGLYQGASVIGEGEHGRSVEHRFGYNERDVMRVTEAAARIAAVRSGRLSVVAKDAGLPDLTRLWFDCARRSADAHGVKLRTLDIDYGVYAFISEPEEFDVLVVPNCFGDIMADLGGVFCGSRGSTYGGSYSEYGAAVYQTNHGAAYDLAGKDKANPVGQMLGLAMMLHETHRLSEEAAAIVGAIRQTWRQGWRTADLMAPGRRLVGTAEFSRRVLENLHESVGTAAAE